MVQELASSALDFTEDSSARQAQAAAGASSELISNSPPGQLSVHGAIGPLAPAIEIRRVIPWRRFRERISYSACNEDSASEVEVLQPGPAKRLVCISAGGGRVLNLLEEGAEEIWAVDVNPPQLHLLELKVASIRSLEHAAYLEFLGVRTSLRRLDIYESLRPQLSPAAQSYFDTRPDLVLRGALYQGSLERFLARYVARIMQFFCGRWIARLFDCRSLTEQSRLLPRYNTPLFRLVGHTLCRKGFFQLFSHDPGFWRFVPPEIRLHERIFALLHRYLEHHLARENHLLWLVFHGRYGDERVMPQYLLPEPFARIKAALGKVRLRAVHGELGRVLEDAPAEHFDGYSLSDISSYLTQEAFTATIEQVLRTARPGACLCSRGIFFHRPFSAEHSQRLERDQTLEQRLELDDHAMVHAFAAAKVR